MNHNYTLMRSKRKTVSLVVQNDGGLLVKAPLKYPVDKIDAFVKSKSEWIIEKLKKVERQKEKQSLEEPSFEPESTLRYLGREYALKIELISSKERIVRQNQEIVIYTKKMEESHLMKLLESYYKDEAQIFIVERLLALSQRIGITPQKVQAKTQKKRWGTCNSKGAIYINWKLILTPPEIFEYVLIHEWAHLIHLDHSKAFWQVVNRVDPHYKSHVSWLKEHSYIIRWPYN